tara:strand:+ start:128 stop:1000 length:873 start_codon:yes stop_codon:yes gene_type:complete
MIFDKIIHIPNKIFYPIKNIDQEINQTFSKFGFIKDLNEIENKKLANEINDYLKKIDLKKIINSHITKNPQSYSINIFNYLDEEIQNKVLNFFTNIEKIKKINSMLGYEVKFRSIVLMLNFYNKETKENEGPKMFHRDSDSLQDQVKIFMLINNIDDRNGMFYFVPKNIINEDTKLPFEKDLKNLSLEDKWRNHDKTVYLLAKKKKIKDPIMKLHGYQGELLYVDTGKVYHKGGYISEKDKMRLLLQAVYTPVLSLSNWNNNKNFILKFIQNKLTSLRIKFRKTIILDEI